VKEPRRSHRSPDSDESLALSAATGADAAFDELRRRYARGLSRYGARLLGDLDLGVDVAERALRDARRALRRGSRPTCVSPWLHRLTLNAALDLRADCPDEPIVAARLPEHQRQAFVLREVYGLSMQEIATELGLSATEVQEAQFVARSRLSRVGALRRARRAEASVSPPARRRSARPAILAVAAAAVALCVGMPVAATYAPDRSEDPAPVLAIPPADRAL
jgi:RNA polymerase sigma-70 factor (ECF subfamily)